MTKFAPDKVVKFIAWCKLTFDERFALHRVEAYALHQVQVDECGQLLGDMPGHDDQPSRAS